MSNVVLNCFLFCILYQISGPGWCVSVCLLLLTKRKAKERKKRTLWECSAWLTTAHENNRGKETGSFNHDELDTSGGVSCVFAFLLIPLLSSLLSLPSSPLPPLNPPHTYYPLGPEEKQVEEVSLVTRAWLALGRSSPPPPPTHPPPP